MKNLMKLITFICCISVFAIACGESGNNEGNGDENAGNGDSDDTQLISEMSDEDAQVLCDESDQAWHDAPEPEFGNGFCKAGGYIAGAFAEEGEAATACTEANDECLAEEPAERVDLESEAGAGCSIVDLENRDECEATAGQYIACRKERIDGIAEGGDSFECSDFNDVENAASETIDEALNLYFGEGPECQEFYDNCDALSASDM